MLAKASPSTTLPILRRQDGIALVDKPFDYGNEHEVYLSQDDPRWAIKVPRPRFAPLWQDMSAEAAQRDLDLLREYGMPTLHTRLFCRQVLKTRRGRRQTSYLLEQPYFSFYPMLSYPDLIGRPNLVDQFSLILSIRHRIFRDHGLGADVLGGNNGYRNGFGYFYERLRRLGFHRAIPHFRFDPFIPNLLLPKHEVHDEDGRPIVEAGKIILGDVRLFRLEGASTWYRKRIQDLLQFLYDVETGAGVAMVTHLDGYAETDLVQDSSRGNCLG